MRIQSVLFATTLFAVSGIAAQAGPALVSQSPRLATNSLQRPADIGPCEKERLELKIARVDARRLAQLVQDCMNRALAGTGFTAVVPQSNWAQYPNDDQHETLAQAIDICSKYAAKQLPNCVAAEMPR